jgi:hypothetical protein
MLVLDIGLDSGRMDMSIDEPRQQRHPLQTDHPIRRRPASGTAHDFDDLVTFGHYRALEGIAARGREHGGITKDCYWRCHCIPP